MRLPDAPGAGCGVFPLAGRLGVPPCLVWVWPGGQRLRPWPDRTGESVFFRARAQVAVPLACRLGSRREFWLAVSACWPGLVYEDSPSVRWPGPYSTVCVPARLDLRLWLARVGHPDASVCRPGGHCLRRCCGPGVLPSLVCVWPGGQCLRRWPDRTGESVSVRVPARWQCHLLCRPGGPEGDRLAYAPPRAGYAQVELLAPPFLFWG